MSRSNRIPKTLQRRLSDLDDHLFLLEEALTRLVDGETAYLKSLAAELRVLVCDSSHTEGLLWRLAEEMNVPDPVHVHLLGNIVDHKHPLLPKPDFAFVPLFPAGQGDPRIRPNFYSLRKIIKNCEAVYISGEGITHETLIRHVAQQMGSAHEDDGVDPHLAELSEILFSGKQPFIQVLTSDAYLVLEVGERLIKQAEKIKDFERKKRQRSTPQAVRQGDAPTHTVDNFVYDHPPSLPEEGTIFFCIDHPHKGWSIDDQSYSFAPLKKGPLIITPNKHPDGTIEIAIEGLLEEPIVSRRPIPESEQPGVTVAATWTKENIIVYLNGQQVDIFYKNKSL